MPKLVLEEIAVRFGTYDALKRVSFSVEEGAFVTLLGPSGCGKTTLLNVIAGFVQPLSGQIFIDGRNVTALSPERRDTAMCFQSYALFPHLSVARNIAFGPRQKKLAQMETARRVASLLKTFELEAHAEKLPNALSGGQQQRVALARALAVAPGLVLFDEPLSNLDAKLRDQVRHEIRALQRDLGFTALYVTHDQAEALALSDTVYLLNQGVIEQAGSPRQIYFQPKTRFVADFIGAANLHSGPIVDGVMMTPFGPLQVNAADKDHALVCWRPEVVRLGGPLSGRAAESAFQGAYSDVFVTAEKETVRLQLPGRNRIVPGAAVSFAIAPEDVVLLEESDHG
ncbi:ABC transporter ATP-binding protein [Allorhizobium sp. BGMRC 0089]|uniref:ABC transporter ATP-binding protein n=1 Tax=Allorhizobium sonneratiae TaxID=2934936 RepID=UPI00203475D5|nr:ABC transporter ATP-binding protein [Allorhizobium sonneratiae]MCM2293913.1 ABC transporter ATP-binding protein [Allorhizobium sonneratiae]